MPSSLPGEKCVPSSIVFRFSYKYTYLIAWKNPWTISIHESLFELWGKRHGLFCFIFTFSRQIYGKTDVHMLYNHIANDKTEVFWTCARSSFHNPWAGFQEQSVLLFFTAIFSEKKRPKAPELDWSQVSYSQDSKTFLCHFWPKLFDKFYPKGAIFITFSVQKSFGALFTSKSVQII